MAVTLTDLATLGALPFDEVIDVRAPAEYAEDHIPGAISLPVLSDLERAQVGTIYTQSSRFEARKVGAALVARNAARHLEGALRDRPGGWRPLVYCWRGGQRSGSFASILAQIGWRVDTIDGGYRSYRRLVVRAMHETPLPHRLVLLDGDTGTAKTALLHRLAARGHQVLDLEGLAAHRGSIFGAVARPQPAQKAFEGALAVRLAAMDPARPVLAEAESSRIGALQIPPSLWAAMGAAPRLRVAAPVAARARYLVRAYAELTADAGRIAPLLDGLRRLQGHARVDRWQQLAAGGAFEALADELIREHYDRRYRRHRSRRGAPADPEIALDSLDEPALDAAAARLEAALEQLAPPA
ncbi:tRNA 2-selenouridine(34) synthase MnmH [Rhodobacteraceae bacterium 2CG4]|uniref:tRNA 2-selenouridine(34) synthase MnmH n=1 Tax=Halovulum marinum TaxID=2662447 RepID=A0A6L5Z0R6_9RHOB|nr:tRNA 2-selenouridine(34) synthase MnmH [Halovulum marinum]MSU90156.1 tRNA 2-selenouridine(34) synthase MnmH [Halovulum marinum]